MLTEFLFLNQLYINYGRIVKGCRYVNLFVTPNLMPFFLPKTVGLFSSAPSDWLISELQRETSCVSLFTFCHRAAVFFGIPAASTAAA